MNERRNQDWNGIFAYIVTDWALCFCCIGNVLLGLLNRLLEFVAHANARYAVAHKPIDVRPIAATVAFAANSRIPFGMPSFKSPRRLIRNAIRSVPSGSIPTAMLLATNCHDIFTGAQHSIEHEKNLRQFHGNTITLE